MATKGKTKAKGPVIQGHHISYENPEWVVYITKAEHLVLTRLGWYTKKRVSQGLITALLQFCLENYKRAESLGEEVKNG